MTSASTGERQNVHFPAKSDNEGDPGGLLKKIPTKMPHI
jgi:hypothetical protein